ncbi:MAG TPA: NUDIX hydrolase, partial [Ilumatobacteraceae bacterium]|nr:NUDIX hydrolase [Ilumatobacteraceae bacterium]
MTAARELTEEVGLRAAQLQHLTDFYPSAGMTDSVLYLYLATGLTEVDHERHGPEEEYMEVLHLPLGDALAMIERGEIKDAKSVIGLLLTDRMLTRGDVAVVS